MPQRGLFSRLFASLRGRLILLLLFAVLPLLVLQVITAAQQRESAAQQALDDAFRITQLVATNQTEFIDYTEQLLLALSQLQDVRQQNDGACDTLLTEVVQQFPIYTVIYTVDAEGNTICSGYEERTPTEPVTNTHWFGRVQDASGFVLGNYTIGQFSGLGIVPAAVPLRDDDGTFTGAVAAHISLAWLSDFLANADVPEQSVLAVLDKGGTVLAVYPEEGFRQSVGTNAAENPIFIVMKETGEGTRRFTVGDNVGVILGQTEYGDAESGVYIALLRAEASAFAEVNEIQNRNLLLLGITTLAAIVIAVFGSRWFLLQPIQNLTVATSQLGRGDLSARVDVARGVSELDTLATSFNQMAADLEQRERELEETNAGLAREVEERRLAEEELRKFTVQLESSNQELEQFAYVASHDLQEPLRVVAGYLQLLERRYKGKLDSDADEFIAFAVDAAKRMQNLINDLLAYSRIGRKIRPFEPTDMNRVVAEAQRNLALLVEETGATIEVGELPTVMSDPSQLMLVFQNLIANGIKFRSEAPPRIEIGARECPEGWEFHVRDNGIGIDPQYNKRIFLIFQRLHTRDEYPGTGIGLAICQKIVEYHGGKIWVDSQMGEGTTFHFTLPKREEEEA